MEDLFKKEMELIFPVKGFKDCSLDFFSRSYFFVIRNPKGDLEGVDRECKFVRIDRFVDLIESDTIYRPEIFVFKDWSKEWFYGTYRRNKAVRSFNYCYVFDIDCVIEFDGLIENFRKHLPEEIFECFAFQMSHGGNVRLFFFYDFPWSPREEVSNFVSENEVFVRRYFERTVKEGIFEKIYDVKVDFGSVKKTLWVPFRPVKIKSFDRCKNFKLAEKVCDFEFFKRLIEEEKKVPVSVVIENKKELEKGKEKESVKKKPKKSKVPFSERTLLEGIEFEEVNVKSYDEFLSSLEYFNSYEFISKFLNVFARLYPNIEWEFEENNFLKFKSGSESKEVFVKVIKLLQENRIVPFEFNPNCFVAVDGNYLIPKIYEKMDWESNDKFGGVQDSGLKIASIMLAYSHDEDFKNFVLNSIIEKIEKFGKKYDLELIRKDELRKKIEGVMNFHIKNSIEFFSEPAFLYYVFTKYSRLISRAFRNPKFFRKRNHLQLKIISYGLYKFVREVNSYVTECEPRLGIPYLQKMFYDAMKNTYGAGFTPPFFEILIVLRNLGYKFYVNPKLEVFFTCVPLYESYEQFKMFIDEEKKIVIRKSGLKRNRVEEAMNFIFYPYLDEKVNWHFIPKVNLIVFRSKKKIDVEGIRVASFDNWKTDVYNVFVLEESKFNELDEEIKKDLEVIMKIRPPRFKTFEYKIERLQKWMGLKECKKYFYDLIDGKIELYQLRKILKAKGFRKTNFNFILFIACGILNKVKRRKYIDMLMNLFVFFSKRRKQTNFNEEEILSVLYNWWILKADRTIPNRFRRLHYYWRNAENEFVIRKHHKRHFNVNKKLVKLSDYDIKLWWIEEFERTFRLKFSNEFKAELMRAYNKQTFGDVIWKLIRVFSDKNNRGVYYEFV